jgi:methionyl aminopeptidase
MITIKSEKEIRILQQGGRILAKVLKTVAKNVRPGISTDMLDKLAFKLIKEAGGTPAFLHYKATFMSKEFPTSLCVSINDVIVHGIPDAKTFLKEGDIVSLDIGMVYKGLYTDTALTVPVGKVNPRYLKLMKVTKEALDRGIRAAKAGNTLGDIGYAIESHFKKNGMLPIRNLVGHGVGYQVHEDPEIFNYGTPHSGVTLKPGYVLALEPMGTYGTDEIVENSDDSFATKNGEYAAHFEHTIAILKDRTIIITK